MKTTAARPSWDEYFLNVAKAISMRSTCLRRKYGAVIVDTSNAIVSSGYNGSPVGEENCSDHGECKREELHVPKGERYELCKAVHAEQNAIINCTKQRMIGSTIYIYGENADGTLASGAPCLLCKRMIKNAGIKTVVFKSKYGVIMHIQASQLNNYKEEDPSKTIIPKDDSYTHTKVIVGFSLSIANHAPRLLTRSEYYLRCETIDAKKELNAKFGTWFLSGKGSAVIEYKHNKISLDIEVIKEDHPINEFGKTPAEMVEDICLVARTCDSLIIETGIIAGGGVLSIESIKRKLDVVEANSVNDKGDKKESITKIVNDIKTNMFETLEKEESYTKSVISGLYSLCDKDGTSINTSSFIILYDEMDKFKETLQKMYGEANGTTIGFDDPEHHSLKIIFTKRASQDIRFYPVLTITEVIDAIDANYVNSTISYDEKGKIQTRSPYRRRTINMLYQTTSKIRISPEAKKAITETIPDTLANIDTTLRAKNEDSIRKAVEKFDVAPTPVIRDTFGAKAEPNDDKWHKQVRVRYDFDGKKGGESYTTEEEKEVLTRLLKLDCGEPVMLHGSCESMSFKDDDMSLNVRYDTVYNEDDNGESAHQIILHIMEAYRALSDENAQDTKTKPVVGIDAMAVRIMTDITSNNIKRGCCTYIPTSQKAIFFQLLINKYGTLNCDGENAYSTKTNTAKISIRTYLVPAEEVTVCGAGAAIDKVREVYYEGFQEFMQMPIDHKTYELNPVTVSFYAINKDNTYEKAVNVSVAIGDFDDLMASINHIVEAYHYSPVFLAKNVNCPNIFPGSEKYTEGNKTYSYQRDGHFDIVVVTNKATIPTTLISLADAVTAIASIVVGC